MAEYIKREAAVKAAQDGADEWDGGYNRNRNSCIEAAICNVPTADVAEVRHGRWIIKDESYCFATDASRIFGKGATTNERSLH